MTRTFSVVAVFVSCLLTGLARADAQEVAQRCIDSIAQVRVNTVRSIHTVADNGVTRIERLDADGAPDAVLIHAARESNMRIQSITDSSSSHIARLVQACVRELRALDADAELIQSVREAGRFARERIATVSDHGSFAIHRALHDALVSD